MGISFISAAAVTLYLVPFLARGIRARVHDDRYLTATTVSGPRTVDLHRLTEVRRFRLPAGSIELNRLELVDADGVQLVVNDETADRDEKRVLADYAVF